MIGCCKIYYVIFSYLYFMKFFIECRCILVFFCDIKYLIIENNFYK